MKTTPLALFLEIEAEVNLRTDEVLSSVFFELFKPIDIHLDICQCDYCRAHIAYTYYNINAKKTNWEYAIKRAAYYREIRDNLFRVGITTQVHADDCKRFIGRNIGSIKQFLYGE